MNLQFVMSTDFMKSYHAALLRNGKKLKVYWFQSGIKFMTEESENKTSLKNTCWYCYYKLYDISKFWKVVP